MYSFDKAKSGAKAIKAQAFIKENGLLDIFETSLAITGKGQKQSFVNDLYDITIESSTSMKEVLDSYLEKKSEIVKSKIILVEPTEEELDDIIVSGINKDTFIRNKLSDHIKSMPDGDFAGIICRTNPHHSIPLMLLKHNNKSYFMVLDKLDSNRFKMHDKDVFFADTLVQKSQMGCHIKSVILVTKAVELAQNELWSPVDIVKECLYKPENNFGFVEFHLPDQLARFSQDSAILSSLPEDIKEKLPKHQATIIDTTGTVVSKRNMILQDKSVKMAQILQEKREREKQQSQGFVK